MRIKITRGSVCFEKKDHTPGDVLDVPQEVIKTLEGSRTLDFEKLQEDPQAPEPIAPPVFTPPVKVEEEPAKVKKTKAKASAKKKNSAKSAKGKKGKGNK